MQLYADMLFRGGRIYTADPNGPRWVDAVAVRDGRILAVGGGHELDELRGPQTEVVDLKGGLLLPGFTESHLHFIELALRASEVDVTYAPSAAAALAAVAERAQAMRAAGAGENAWLQGGGWNENVWTDARAAPAAARRDRAGHPGRARQQGAARGMDEQRGAAPGGHHAGHGGHRRAG